MVDQGASLVDQALANNEVWGYDGWKEIAPAAKEHTLHLIGLLSDGGVHSRYDQLVLVIKGVRLWPDPMRVPVVAAELLPGA